MSKLDKKGRPIPEPITCAECGNGSTWPHETDKTKHWTSPLVHVKIDGLDAWVHQHCAAKALKKAAA